MAVMTAAMGALPAPRMTPNAAPAVESASWYTATSGNCCPFYESAREEGGERRRERERTIWRTSTSTSSSLVKIRPTQLLFSAKKTMLPPPTMKPNTSVILETNFACFGPASLHQRPCDSGTRASRPRTIGAEQVAQTDGRGDRDGQRGLVEDELGRADDRIGRERGGAESGRGEADHFERPVQVTYA